MAKKIKEVKQDNSRLCAILSYFIVGIIWFFADDKLRGNNSLKFHVKQALNLLIVCVVISVAMKIIMFGVLFFAILFLPLYYIISLTLFILWILGIINAAADKEKPIPLVGKFADKYLNF